MLAVVGLLALIAAGVLGIVWWRNAPGDWPQPTEPLAIVLDGKRKLIKFGLHGTAGTEFQFYLLTDGAIVCDVTDRGGATQRHRGGTVTVEQARALQRAISSTDFMHQPTNQTTRMFVCGPKWTYDIYFFDDVRGQLVHHWESDHSHPELAMLEDAIWNAFKLEQWVAPLSESR